MLDAAALLEPLESSPEKELRWLSTREHRPHENLVVVFAQQDTGQGWWRNPPPERSWDLWVFQHSDLNDTYCAKADMTLRGDAPRWPAMAALLGNGAEKLSSYEYIWFADSSLQIEPNTIDSLFTVSKSCGFELSEPAVAPTGKWRNPIGIRNRYFLARWTTAVDSTAPCFRVSLLRQFAGVLMDPQLITRIDEIWPQLFKGVGPAGIVDAIEVTWTGASLPPMPPDSETPMVIGARTIDEHSLTPQSEPIEMLWRCALGSDPRCLTNENYVRKFYLPQLQSFAGNPGFQPDGNKAERLEVAQSLLEQARSGEAIPGLMERWIRLIEEPASSLAPWEETFRDGVQAAYQPEPTERARASQMALWLYEPPHRLPAPIQLDSFPEALRAQAVAWLLRPPDLTFEQGEAEAYSAHLENVATQVWAALEAAPDSPLTKLMAREFAMRVNLIQGYFAERNLAPLYRLRGQIMRRFLMNEGARVDCSFPARKAKHKIRVGIILSQFVEHTETYTTIPAFEHLDPELFAVRLFALRKNNSTMERACERIAGSPVTLLPSTVMEAVQQLRDANLDVALIGTNVSAVTSQLALIACCRVARHQSTAFSSPVTTGFASMDYYLSGSLAETELGGQPHYSERLIMMDGPGFCFEYGLIPAPSLPPMTRDELGLTKDAVVYASGANMFKIDSELVHTWATVLANVPGSMLLLYPFGPAWSNSYPQHLFRTGAEAIFASKGVDPRRVRFLNGLPGRAHVLRLMPSIDVYLDSFPYSGANSNVDPLQFGIPVVTRRGVTLRSQQGPAMLLDLGLPELVANGTDEYAQVAVRLGCEGDYRQGLGNVIRERMRMKPRFLDTRDYCRQMADIMIRLVRGSTARS